MRFVVTGEWTRNHLLKSIVWCFLGYTLLLWISNFGMYFSKMTLAPGSVVDYYLGNDAAFLQPRTLQGMLEVLHMHAFAMGILLLTLTHLLLFVPIPMRAKAWGICTAFVSGVGDELAGWGVRFVSPHFAIVKVGFFVLMQSVLLVLMVLVVRALLFDQPSAYTEGDPEAQAEFEE
ncbi:MAG TPA: hypothetical protein VGK20_09555 [Candidatus Binatia bacterium]|jgi:hypothetical protein